MDIAKIRILLDLDGSSVVTGAPLAAGAVATMERSMTASLARVKTAFATLTPVQKLLGGAAIAAIGIGAAMSAVVGPAIEFESAFAGVRKTVDGTPQQLAAVRTALLDASRVMPTTANELAAIAENAGALGVAVPQVVNFSTTIAKLGETTDLSFDAAAQSLARFLTLTDGGVQDIEGVANVLVDLGNNSATTESQIVTLATRMAGAFAAANVPKEDILGLAAAMSSLGIEAESGGTAANRVLLALRDAAITGGVELDAFASTAGVLPEEFKRIAQSSPVDAIVLFVQGLQRMSDAGESTTPVLETLGLGSLRVREALNKLSEGSELVVSSLDRSRSALTEGGALAEEYGKRIETTASRLEIFQNRLTALAIALGTPALSTFAQTVDLAGDAIEALASVMAPLGAQVGQLFATMAQSAGVFFDVIGGPAIGVAVAGLTGLVTILSGVVGALNALGPAGVVLAVLAADLLLVGPASMAAFQAVSFLVGAFGALKVATATATIPLIAAQMIAVVAPIAAVVGGLVLLGRELINSGREAKAAGEAVQSAFDAAVVTGDLTQISNVIATTTARMAELEQQARLGGGGFSEFGNNVLGAAQVLTPFTDNTVRNSRLELEQLKQVASENGMGLFAEDVANAARITGLSQEAVIKLAQEMGILGQLTGSTTADFFSAVEALQQFSGGTQNATEQQQSLREQLLLSQLPLTTISSGMGLFADTLGVLAGRVDDVDLADLLDEDTPTRVAAFDALVAELQGEITNLANAAGLSTDEFLRQVGAVDALTASHSALRQAVEGGKDALATLAEQERLTAEATERFSTALDSVSDSASFEEAARALGDLSFEYAASSASAGEFAVKNDAATRALLEVGRQAGLTEAEMTDYIANLATIPPTILTEILAEAAQARLTADEMRALLEETAKEYVATLSAEDRAKPIIEELTRLGIGFDLSDFNADLTASDLASGEIARVAGVGNDYALADYTALLKATDQATVLMAATKGVAIDYATSDYTAAMRARDEASGEISTRKAQATDYATSDYTAAMRARDEASGEISTRKAQATDYARSDYTASLTAADRASITILATKGIARNYATGDYTAYLQARDRASSVINGAVSALSRFRSKTITIRTQHVQQFSGPRNFGGITGGLRSYAAGGISGGPVGFEGRSGPMLSANARPVIERPQAGIYTALPGARLMGNNVFAEPETGGEAFIPFAYDRRNQALAIWRETGRRLGAMNNGGIIGRAEAAVQRVTGGTLVQFNPSMVVNVYPTPGMDEQAIAEIASRQVQAGLDRQARKIANARI